MLEPQNMSEYTLHRMSKTMSERMSYDRKMSEYSICQTVCQNIFQIELPVMRQNISC